MAEPSFAGDAAERGATGGAKELNRQPQRTAVTARCFAPHLSSTGTPTACSVTWPSMPPRQAW